MLSVRNTSFVDRVKQPGTNKNNFDWVSRCVNTFANEKTCYANGDATKFNKVLVYIYDIIPEMLRGILLSAWRTRINEIYEKRLALVTDKQSKFLGVRVANPKFFLAVARHNLDWKQDASEPAFIEGILSGKAQLGAGKATKVRNALKILLGESTSLKEHFGFNYEGRSAMRIRKVEEGSGEFQSTGLKDLKKLGQGIATWDVPALKNMLLFYNLGTAEVDTEGESRPLVRAAADSDAEYQEKVELVRVIASYRNTIAHQVGLELKAEAKIDDIEKTVTLVLDKFFSPLDGLRVHIKAKQKQLKEYAFKY